ncbi:hypothetical protein ANANG_G00129260, partial [Anguilla anguilla]
RHLQKLHGNTHTHRKSPLTVRRQLRNVSHLLRRQKIHSNVKSNSRALRDSHYVQSRLLRQSQSSRMSPRKPQQPYRCAGELDYLSDPHSCTGVQVN